MIASTAEKYDSFAEGFAERTWANLEFDMRRRLKLALTWGEPLEAGDSVLEFGCGDGYLAQIFAQDGFHYRGLDISPAMLAMAQKRLAAAGLTGSFLEADGDEFYLTHPVDAVVSYMGAFFSFINDPLALLKRMRPYIRKKIIVDLNPRGPISIREAVDMLNAANFKNVAWRPFFVPVTKKLPEIALKTLSACETVPVLRGVPLRWKFNVLLKGEVGDSRGPRLALSYE